jgi:hypothetical protein
VMAGRGKGAPLSESFQSDPTGPDPVDLET